MVTIKQDTPTKISGITSLYVSFPFNAEIVQIIKQCEKYSYNKKTYTWEVPLTELAYLLDNIAYFDDVTVEFQPFEKKRENISLIVDHEIKPFEHQVEGILYALNHSDFLLLDDPGMGKTTTIIYLAEELKAQRGLEHCLVICGINTLKSNWEKEIHKFSKLGCRVIGKKLTRKGTVTYASTKERAAELINKIDEFFIVINVEMLRNDDIIHALRTTKNNIGMVVLDEAHKCSAVSRSQQGQNLLKLTNYDHRIALTGTLIQNDPLSAYTALKWIGVEHANLTNFKSQYCVFGGFGGYQIVGYKNLDLLKTEIDSCSLRRRKADIQGLPPKIVIPEILEMNDTHRKFYENIVDGVKSECDKIEINAANALSLMTRLRQATACPSILTSENIESTKIERAVDLVDEICATGEKVVIMSMFKETLNVLKERLKQYFPLSCTGDIADDVVSKNIDMFQSDPKYKVLLGTVAKCGTGITLNAASYLICIDTPWTAGLQEQVEDRINRITNTHSATIYRLICQNTVDELVEHIIETKQAFSDFIVDDKVDTSTLNILRQYIQDL